MKEEKIEKNEVEKIPMGLKILVSVIALGILIYIVKAIGAF